MNKNIQSLYIYHKNIQYIFNGYCDCPNKTNSNNQLNIDELQKIIFVNTTPNLSLKSLHKPNQDPFLYNNCITNIFIQITNNANILVYHKADKKSNHYYVVQHTSNFRKISCCSFLCCTKNVGPYRRFKDYKKTKADLFHIPAIMLDV